MQKPQVFGADYSVYVRTVRLTLHEKGIDYDLVPIDVFADGGPPPSYLARHPFGRIPAFEHDGFCLYETAAITRYIDEAFAGPELQPRDPRHRARVNQLISIADAYIYPTLVWGVYFEEVSKPRRGNPTDETRRAAALSKTVTCLEAVAAVMGEAPWLGGPSITLADLYLAPMMDYFLKTSQGSELLSRHINLIKWWDRMQAQTSMQDTRPTT